MLESTCSERLEMLHTLSIVLRARTRLSEPFSLIPLPVCSMVNEVSFDLSKLTVNQCSCTVGVARYEGENTGK